MILSSVDRGVRWKVSYGPGRGSRSRGNTQA